MAINIKRVFSFKIFLLDSKLNKVYIACFITHRSVQTVYAKKKKKKKKKKYQLTHNGGYRSDRGNDQSQEHSSAHPEIVHILFVSPVSPTILIVLYSLALVGFSFLCPRVCVCFYSGSRDQR